MHTVIMITLLSAVAKLVYSHIKLSNLSSNNIGSLYVQYKTDSTIIECRNVIIIIRATSLSRLGDNGAVPVPQTALPLCTATPRRCMRNLKERRSAVSSILLVFSVLLVSIFVFFVLHCVDSYCVILCLQFKI